MGRSGGGHHRSGGGFRSHSHSHHRSYHRNRYHSSSGSSSNSPVVIVIFLAIFIIGVTSVIAVVLANDLDDNSKNNPELSPMEQFLWCGDRETKFKYTSSNIKVYESVNGTPAMSTETRFISKSVSGYLSNSYRYESFYLAPGSEIKGHKDHTSSTTYFIVIKGWNQMEEFMDDDYYTYIYKGYADDFDIKVSEFDEYFVVIDGKRSAKYDAQIDVTLATYDTEDLTERCTSHSPSCTLNEEKNSDFCVVLDYDVDSTSSIYRSVKITIDDGTGSDVSVTTIITLAICFILVLAVVIAVVRVLVGRAKSKKKSAEAEISMTEGSLEDPEVDAKASMIDGDVSYPVASPSDVPSAIITTADYPSPVGAYPTAPAPASAYATNGTNNPSAANLYPTLY